MRLFIALVCFACFFYFLGTANRNEITLDKLDCDEFGICKEGLEYIYKGNTYIFNKDNCIKHNFEWREDLNACYTR